MALSNCNGIHASVPTSERLQQKGVGGENSTVSRYPNIVDSSDLREHRFEGVYT